MSNIAAYTLVALLLVAGLSLAAIIVSSIRQTGVFGINVDTLNCPRCGARVPAVRTPKTARQFLWGGSSCECGCEIDKWGKEIEQ